MSKGRILKYIPLPVFSRFGRRRSAAKPGAFWHLPAFLLLACTPQMLPDESVPAARKTQIYINAAGKASLQGLDLLFFQDGPLYRLDAYQHLDRVSGTRVTGTSSTAAEKVVILSNYPADTYAWSGVRSLGSLADLPFRLADEDPDAPMLYGESEAGTMGQVTLRPMLAKITLRSIACDFSGRAYAGERLQDVRAYLTYASQECRPFAPEDPPSSWLNAGRLDEAATAALAHPEAVLQTLAASLGGRIYPSAGFYCYPNPSDGTDVRQPRHPPGHRREAPGHDLLLSHRPARPGGRRAVPDGRNPHTGRHDRPGHPRRRRVHPPGKPGPGLGRTRLGRHTLPLIDGGDKR